MPPAPAADATGPASLVLAAFVLATAAFLAWRQWRDYAGRSPDLSRRDESHFARQDLRRVLGTIVLGLVAVGLALGGRMPAVVNGRANLKFVQVWSAVALLIVVLLVLALLDWVSTRLYARRHRQRLTDEGLSIVEAELKIRLARRRERLREHGPNGSSFRDEEGRSRPD